MSKQSTESSHTLRFISFQEHVKNRSMWLGSSVLSDQKYWILSPSGKFEFEKINISDALLKCFDEILVNALDQYIRSIGTPASKGGPVTFINVSFDPASGEITISNNGQGFDIYNNHPDLDDKDEYTVQAVITREYGGSNFGDIKGDEPEKSNEYRVTGGINGLGIKLIVINSTRFSIETVDKSRGKYYHQVISDSMKSVSPPTVLDLKDIKDPKKKQSHTSISFTPDYAALCRKSKNQENAAWAKSTNNLAMFEKIMQFRTHQLAAFINSTSYRYDLSDRGEVRINYNRPASVTFNGKSISPLTLNSFTKLFPIEKSITCSISSDDDQIKFPWSINVCSKSDSKLPWSVSQVNGVFLSEGGSHINWLVKQISDHVSDKVEKTYKNKNKNKKITENHIKNMILIIDCIQIPVPQFSSQSKTSIKLATKELNKLKKTYVIDSKKLDQIWRMLKPLIDIEMSEKPSPVKTDKIPARNIRKYEPARKLGPSATLFVPEGDSACKPIRDIITDKSNSALSTQNSGTYNIQGVPPNSIKETKTNAHGQLVKSKMLESNIAFKGLISAIGLEYNKTYEKDLDFKKLNYGKIVIATDQDLDGIGQICSLILVKFLRFWPNLVERGFVRRLATPLIRVYSTLKSDPVLNFYSDKEYEHWVTSNFGSKENLPQKFSVSYYKGLAGHTEEEVLKDIGANILDNIYTFTLDDACMTLAEAYYGGGKQSDIRKRILSSDETFDYSPENHRRQLISCSEHFQNESREYQLDFMARKLKHAVDGFIPSQRKAFAGARKLWANGGAPKKVYQVTGYVTTEMHYQHGDTSMNDTIIKLAQNFTGGCNIPLFAPISNGFGSRVTGRDETGSPRYINTRLNTKLTDLMFPRQDDWLLGYVYEDGEQAEPEYYVPVLPISVMETSTTVSVGWNIACWGRDPYEVIKSVKRLIMFDSVNLRPLTLMGKPWLRENMRVEVCSISNSGTKPTEVCLGEWNYNEKTRVVHIRQLPLKIWSESYKQKLLGISTKKTKTSKTTGKNATDSDDSASKGKDLVENVFDDTGNDQVDIKVKLVPGGYEEIINRGYGTDEIHPIEDYLEIKNQMHCRLNMITKDGKTREFEQYADVIEYWYPVRREMYKSRLQRLIIILQAQIDYYENQLRFCEEDSEKKINIDKNFTKQKREKILAEAKYTKFNKTRLFQPKYIPVAELEKNMYQIKADYSYIDQITVGQKSMEGIEKQRKKLNECKSELAKLKETTWQKEWLREIDELEEVIREGEKSKWLFGTKKNTFKNAK